MLQNKLKASIGNFRNLLGQSFDDEGLSKAASEAKPFQSFMGKPLPVQKEEGKTYQVIQSTDSINIKVEVEITEIPEVIK